MVGESTLHDTPARTAAAPEIVEAFNARPPLGREDEETEEHAGLSSLRKAAGEENDMDNLLTDDEEEQGERNRDTNS